MALPCLASAPPKECKLVSMPPRSQNQARKKRKAAPKRGATGRAAGTRGGKPANSGGGNNLVLGFVAGVLVGGLAVALWYEKQAPQPATDNQVESTQPAPKAEKKPEPKAPQAGEEFYQKLPEAEVETFSEQKDDKPLTPYVLQTGAFRSRAEADEMEARIVLETGMEVWIDERVSSSGTLWYRVRLGPFEGKRATDRVKRQLWERARIEAVRYQHQPE